MFIPGPAVLPDLLPALQLPNQAVFQFMLLLPLCHIPATTLRMAAILMLMILVVRPLTRQI